MRRIGWSLIHGLLLVGVLSPVLQGQRLTGAVHNAVTPQPLTSAVVSLMDANGVTVDRTVTDRQGRFNLPVRENARRVRIIHIGFLPQDVALPDSAHAGTASIDVAMQPLPQQLAPVRVLDSRCPADPTMASALALWEQAQSGFLATVTARDAQPADALILTFSHSTSKTAPTNLIVSTRRSVSTRLMAAGRSPESYVTQGYVDAVATGWYFNAPDADVLLDHSFQFSHCFSMADPNVAHPDQVGVAFREAAYHPGASDIRGVLWMDRSPLALRSLEFRYTGMAEKRIPTAGGQITFRTADNGIIVIGDWTLWRSGADSVDAGAILISAKWPDGSIPTVVFPTISGTVLDAATHAPMPGAAVHVQHTTYHADAIDDGAFKIDYVFPDQYFVEAFDSTAFAAFGVVPVVGTKVMVTRDKSPTVALAMPSILSTARRACIGNSLGAGEGVVVVRVLDTTGALVKQSVKIHAHSSGIANQKDQDGTISAGRVAFCGVFPANVTIEATDKMKRKGTASITTSGAPVVDTVTIVLRR